MQEFKQDFCVILKSQVKRNVKYHWYLITLFYVEMISHNWLIYDLLS